MQPTHKYTHIYYTLVHMIQDLWWRPPFVKQLLQHCELETKLYTANEWLGDKCHKIHQNYWAPQRITVTHVWVWGMASVPMDVG